MPFRDLFRFDHPGVFQVAGRIIRLFTLRLIYKSKLISFIWGVPADQIDLPTGVVHRTPLARNSSLLAGTAGTPENCEQGRL